MTLISRHVGLSVATVISPASKGGGLEPAVHLAAIGVLTAERHVDDWRFSFASSALSAGESEDRLLAWAADAMPDRGTVIGWQLADTIAAPLLGAAADAEPEIARTFLDRFVRLVTAPSVDLAIAYGGAGAPSLSQLVNPATSRLNMLEPADLESAWAFGERQRLRNHVAAHAIAAVRLWLRADGALDHEAEAAFDAWLVR